MATTASGVYMQPFVAGRRKKVTLVASWTLAATTGVATLVDTDDIAVTLSRTAAGTYALTYPAVPGATPTGAAGRAAIDFEVLNTFDNAAAISGARLSAKAQSLGTATVKIFAGNSGLAADPGASDVVTLTLTFTLDCNT